MTAATGAQLAPSELTLRGELEHRSRRQIGTRGGAKRWAIGSRFERVASKPCSGVTCSSRSPLLGKRELGGVTGLRCESVHLHECRRAPAMRRRAQRFHAPELVRGRVALRCGKRCVQTAVERRRLTASVASPEQSGKRIQENAIRSVQRPGCGSATRSRRAPAAYAKGIGCPLQ